MNAHFQKHGNVKQPIMSPQQLTMMNKMKLIDMVYKNYNQSQLNSSKRQNIETACTVLSGGSNNETLDEEKIGTIANKKVSQKNLKKINSHTKYDTKVQEVSRFSQSGDRCKSGGKINIQYHSNAAQNNSKDRSNNGIFVSFFSNSKDLEFLTKTIGCPASTQNQQNFHTNQKQKPQQQSDKMQQNQSHSTTKVNRTKNISQGGNRTSNNIHLYKSFQNFPYPTASSATATAIPQQNAKDPHNLQAMSGGSTTTTSQSLSQKFLKTLKVFTQNYYGAQDQKNKQRQTYQNKAVNPQILSQKREKTEVRESKESMNDQSSRQLKFGQIMEELERFSLTKNNQPEYLQTEDSLAQSSIIESELEFADDGNIRACTYKRNADTQDEKAQRQRYKSEERKTENFFTQEYLQSRYINTRVEMELQEFKQEIQKKFTESTLKDFKYPRLKLRQHTVDSLSHKRGHSTEEGVLILSDKGRQKLIAQNQIFNTSQKPYKSKVKKNINDEDFPTQILNTCDMRQVPKTLRYQANENDFSILESAPTATKIKTNESGIFQQQEIKGSHVKAMFQNFIKSFETNTIKTTSNNKKSAKQFINSQERFDPGYISMTQNTFDFCNPQQNPNYHRKINQTVIQAPSQTTNKQIESQQQKGVSKQTPKNYSLQLNQVVKKILTEQQPKGSQPKEQQNINTQMNIQSNSFDMDEPCFYTHESNNGKKFKSKALQDQIYIKQVDEENNNNANNSGKNSKNATRNNSQQRNTGEKRSESKNSKTRPSKNNLVAKFYRSNQTLQSPKSRQSKIKSNAKDGTHQEIRNSKPMSIINQSNITSNLSTGRHIQMLNKPFSQSRQGSQSIRQTAKNTVKGNRAPSSSKKLTQHPMQPMVSNFQTDTGASFHNYPNKQVAQNQTDKNRLLLKSSQNKRSNDRESIENMKSKSQNKKSLQNTKQESLTLMQRSFHIQGKTQGIKSSANASPTQGIRKPQIKSQQKSNISQGKIVNLGILNSSSNQSSKAAINNRNNKSSIHGSIGSKQVMSNICSAERVHTEQHQLSNHLKIGKASLLL